MDVLIAPKYIRQQLQDPTLNTHQSLQKIFTDSREIAIQRYFDNPYYTLRIMHKQRIQIDCALRTIFPNQKGLCLVAIGGYGRGELYPYSDLDILILLKEHDQKLEERTQSFMQTIWNAGYKIGHSVRTTQEILTDATADSHLLTAIIESRLISGDKSLFRKFTKRLFQSPPISHQQFFSDKYREQKLRDQKYTVTLEPNIKKNPGNLRYIHILMWLLEYFLNIFTLKDFVAIGIVTEAEHHEIQEIHNTLRMIRYGLHALSNRAEDRLLSTYQKELATLFGYHADDHNSIIQVFMQDYYQVTQRLILLNKIVLAAITEHVFVNNKNPDIEKYNDLFSRKHLLLEITATNFKDNPANILKLFLCVCQHPEIMALSSHTLRTLRETIAQYPCEVLRENTEIKKLFIEIFQQDHLIVKQLQNLLSLGFLDKYVPHFSTINGLMQFDLYHIHSVDQHTLMVIKNLRTIALGDFISDATLYRQIFSEIDQPYLLYLAGFFHDIGKGSGQNHAKFGAAIAWEFCNNHNLKPEDSELVRWLVEQHLFFSKTTKTKDIYDNEVIRDFCIEVNSIRKLNYLTLLTAADAQATNPKLWNDWSISLTHSLYLIAKSTLENSSSHPIKDQNKIETKQTKELILQRGKYSDTQKETLTELWKHWPEKYFLSQSRTTINWHIKHILPNPYPEDTLFFARFNFRIKQCEVTIYSPMFRYLFTNVTAALDQVNLQVMEARIYTINSPSSTKQYSLSQYIVTHDGASIKDKQQIQGIAQILTQYLQKLKPIDALAPKSSSIRRSKEYDYQTIVNTENPEGKNYTILSVHSMDKHGLLARVAYVIGLFNLHVRHAKINTLADKAEDYFYVNNMEHIRITDAETLTALKTAVHNAITT